MSPNIIYEDNDIIVIDKPAGIAVHPKTRYDRMATIVAILSRHFPGIKNVGENTLRPGIVHRLDKETSGLMVIAKNNEAFFELKKQFQERKVEKKYIALLSGILERNEGDIKTPLVKAGPRTKTSSKIFPDKISSSHTFTIVNKRSDSVRSALTEYKVLRRYKDYTLVEVLPKTGRQHQIRVHFASINHPVACDKLYGRKSKKCPPRLNRHFLHASGLKFQLKNALMEFESELPQDLAEAIKTL